MTTSHFLTRFRRVIVPGMKSLWLHRLRSFLTALGIVFGVCSVIAMLAIGEGASYEAQEQIKSLGSRNIILKSVKPQEDQSLSGGDRSYVLKYGLTHDDMRGIRETIPGVTVIVPNRVIRNYIWNVSRRVDGEVIGTVPWYPEMRNRNLIAGRFFSDIEYDDGRSVCVLEKPTADELFPAGLPVGQTVKIASDYYRVIGVMDPLANQNNGTVGVRNRVDHKAYIPLISAKRRFGEITVKRRSGSREIERVELHEITVQVDDDQSVTGVAKAVQTLLNRNHKKNDYEIVVPLELLREAERTKRIFNIVLGSIAAISLLVGGIGIMNIMLASVTERTREIGIRRALGAKRQDIVLQFLVETILLSGAGGLLGVGLGLAIPFLVEQFTDMKTIVVFWSPIAAFTISGLVGVVFGIYPALRAARMDPVEALRHE